MIAALMYHDIRSEAVDGIEHWTVTPGQFREHLNAFLDAGFAPVEVQSVEQGKVGAQDAFCVTFDDAFASFADDAAPILVDLGVSATMFVPTAFVGNRAIWLPGAAASLPLLGWGELRDLAAAGFDFGSHGHTHRALDRLTQRDLDMELRTSRSQLEEKLMEPCTRMAYPFGDHNDAVRRAAVQAGFSAAYAIGELVVSTYPDLTAVPRLTAWGSLSGRELVARARGRSGGAARVAQRMRNTVYRAAREVRCSPHRRTRDETQR